MNAFRRLSLFAVALLFTGCAVTHFRNGTVEASGKPVSKWHHNFAFGLYELGAPMDLSARCPDTKNWSLVTTQETFLTGLFGWSDALFAYGIDIWDPQMVEYTCGK